ncbi:type I restriction enzyme, S subunit [Desulfonatronum zhilinae]|nr:type I restriction enzyme, S subunit [Desulfonatronum zhilinae]
MEKYDNYKDTGIEWIGEIPEHWEIVPIKYSLLIPLTDGPHETPELLPDGIPFISAEAIKNDKIDFNKKRGFISIEEHERFSLKYKPQMGDVYMIKSGATTGNLARVQTNEEFNIWSPLAAFRPAPNKTTTDFLFFYMKSSRFFSAIELGWNYGTQQNIGMNVLENLRMVRPTLQEQTAIANYLDRKTTEIDELIADKKRLLELYEEEKTAIINQAVTKGINPNVPMKDSGIEWLGEIPEHWEVLPIKYTLSKPITDGPHETPELLPDGIPFISAEAIKNDKIDFNKKRGFISREEHERFSLKYKPQIGDVYMIKSGATTGNLAIVETDIEFNIWSPLAAMRPNYDVLLSEFLFYFMKSKSFFSAIEIGWNYGTQQNIGMKVLENIRMVLPSINEQKEIVEHIKVQLILLNSQIEKVNKLIDLLTEYRTALISEVVTGKIKVTE